MNVLFVTHTVDDKGTLATPGIADQIDELRHIGINIDILKTRVRHKSSYLKAAWQVFRLNFSPRKYDLVHATYSLNGLAARCQFKSPVILTLMGSDLMSRQPVTTKSGRDAFLGKLVARLVDQVIVQTPQMTAALPSAVRNVHIIPYGINPQIFHPAAMEPARRALDLPLDEKLVLFPYNPARPEKRYAVVAEAVQLLMPEFKVRPVVVFGQSREVVARYMNACDAMALASDYEGSPVAVREALACGLPVVSTRVGDVPAFITDIDGCYLCDQDPRDMADNLKRVFDRGSRLAITEKVTALDSAHSAAEVLRIYNTMVAK